jgi:ATP-dependent DNA helicase RecQ
MPTDLDHSTELDRRAAALLRELAGPDARFREHQLEAVRDLVAERARVLCVQRTGWGKSAVYFLATALQRERGAGPALIVSPLLALMRNQIAAAARVGVRAHTINSTNREEWDEVRRLLAEDDVDLLLISPERLNNPRFRDELMPVVAERVGLVVVDEAHCISDWGHDFRPDYRRIGELLARLPEGVAVLGTTATANDRVVADVEEQLGGGAPVRTYRGQLGRSSLRFEVVELPGQADRLAWLATWLPRLPGSGIVYTLTKRDSEMVAEWLTRRGVPAEAYSGDVDTERRVAVEDRLLRNELKAVVATSALGMGYDKPDLGFVVHYQAPGSVVAYYQQVGRAGRGLERADVVLLRGTEDRRIQDFFIEQAFPRREVVDAVLAHLASAGDAGASVPELMAQVNLGRARIEAMLKVLDVEGAVARAGSRWIARPDGDWRYDGERYAHVTALRRREQAAMAAYGADGRCLMRALQEELDDPEPRDCGRCAVCTAPRFDGPLNPALVREAFGLLRSRPLVLDVKKMAPSPDGSMRKLAEDVRAEEGRALARLGDGGWDPLVREGLRAGRLGDELVEAAAELLRGWDAPLAWVAAVPSRRAVPGSPGGPADDVVSEFARRLATAAGLPFAPLLTRADDRPPQRGMANAVQQVANVRGAFAVIADPPAGAGLLVDDVRFSGWTLAMTAGQLRRRGAAAVYPLALATAF